MDTTLNRNVFTKKNALVDRLWVLWADSVRNRLSYPMDKAGTPARFQEAFVADAIVSYVRNTGSAQKDLGTYASTQAAVPVSNSKEALTITLPQEHGFTAIGRMAVPGKPVKIKVVDSGGASLAVKVNTLRSGSTRLWSTNKYDRPRFLTSPSIRFKPGKTLPLVSPYGGPIQLVYSGAKAGQAVTITVEGAGSQPFLDMRPDQDNSAAVSKFIHDLPATKSDWAEMRMGTVELHSKVDYLRETINDNYGGDAQRFVNEVNDLFIGGAYSLAGFAVPNKPLNPDIAQQCFSLGWDCTSEKLHRMPGTQHVNADVYANCGSGCAGNPYDQDWNLDPRGWGESHEIGHNLQVPRLKVYGNITTEVSNQIFPLQKNWRIFRDFGEDLGAWRVKYHEAYDMIAAARTEADPVDSMYKRLWTSGNPNGAQMAFYTQWTHYWADAKADPAKAWDIWTLLYLHQRLVDQSDWDANKAKLGYSTYAERPDSSNSDTSTTGNDNLLIGLSWLTQRDQRPTFAMWGIKTSTAAQLQVQAYGFPTQPAFFYANNTTNNYSTAVRLDMSHGTPAWPFP